MVKNFFSPNVWQMMTVLNPLDALIPKIPCSFFADFWVWVTSEARGSVSVGFWGSCQLSPFWGGGSSQGAVSTPTPHPLSIESPSTPGPAPPTTATPIRRDCVRRHPNGTETWISKATEGPLHGRSHGYSTGPGHRWRARQATGFRVPPAHQGPVCYVPPLCS